MCVSVLAFIPFDDELRPLQVFALRHAGTCAEQKSPQRQVIQ